MRQKSQNIQLVLSKLINNPRCLIRALGSPGLFFSELELSESCQEELINFLNTNSHAFLSSSLFLARKRFLAILESLQLFTKLKTLDCLDIYWNKYLFSFKLDDHAPKNPIYESLDFCRYIKKNEKLEKLEEIILDYEIERNTTILSYSTCPDSYSSLRIHTEKITEDNLQHYQLFFHPCLRIVKFFCNLSSLIASCQTQPSLDFLCKKYKKEEEYVLFYKNYNNGKITSVKFTQQLKDIFDGFLSGQSLQDNLNLWSKNSIVAFDEFKQVLDSLVNFGICMVLPFEIEDSKDVS